MQDGREGINVNYDATDYIPISEGQTYYLFKGTNAYCPRTLCYYNSKKESLADFFIENSTYIFPYVEGACYVRISLPAGKANEYMLVLEPEPTHFSEYGKYYLRKELVSEIPGPVELNAAFSLCGGNALKASVDLLPENEKLLLSNFPKNLKKGITMTFFANFEAFNSVSIGKGYNSYRGDWLEIDSTKIKWKHFESAEETKITKPHGLAINEFLMVVINIDNDSVCHVALSTISNTVTFDFDWVYEQNGTPFTFGNQLMNNVEFGAVANDISCPIWLFGDSYFGVAKTRIIGQLKNLGYADYCLIDGLAGQVSSGAYSEFEKLIALGGVPKMLVWCLGMNDSATNYQAIIAKLKRLSEKYGFELVLQKVPVVPPRVEQNIGVNDIVTASGLRYVDAYKAVGADGMGAWYTDYLSSDNVHPSVIGAKAIAARMIVDVPEIMQYGYRQGSIDGGINGDK